MRIVHVVEPFATGINTFIHELVFGLPNCEHIIIHGEREENRAIHEIKKEYKDKAQFIKWQNAKREISISKDYKAYRELSNILSNLTFDVLHLHSSKAGILGRIYALSTNFKNVVYTPNGASFLRTDVSSFQNKIFEGIEKLFSFFPGKIVSSSNSEHQAYKGINITTNIVQNGVQVECKKHYQKSPQNVINVISCGKITIQKNPALFNQIANHFQDNPAIKFTWIGDGELRHELGKNVLSLGWQNKNEVINLMCNADLYLSTSSWEGLPLAVIEAMGCGLPLVLNNCPGNKDLVLNSENGFLFNNFEEAISQLALLNENTQKRAEFSKASQAIYKTQFNNFKCASAYFKIYQSHKKRVNIGGALSKTLNHG